MEHGKVLDLVRKFKRTPARKEVIAAFVEVDEDGSCLISPDELRKGLFERLGVDASGEEIAEVFKHVDKTNNGRIDIVEFATFLEQQAEDANSQKETYNEIDVSKADGNIDYVGNEIQATEYDKNYEVDRYPVGKTNSDDVDHVSESCDSPEKTSDYHLDPEPKPQEDGAYEEEKDNNVQPSKIPEKSWDYNVDPEPKPQEDGTYEEQEGYEAQPSETPDEPSDYNSDPEPKLPDPEETKPGSLDEPNNENNCIVPLPEPERNNDNDPNTPKEDSNENYEPTKPKPKPKPTPGKNNQVHPEGVVEVPVKTKGRSSQLLLLALVLLVIGIIVGVAVASRDSTNPSISPTTEPTTMAPSQSMNPALVPTASPSFAPSTVPTTTGMTLSPSAAPTPTGGGPLPI